MSDQKPCVLIVDDEQVVCDLLYAELSERGYPCTTALDGNDALNKLTTQNFDVALVDIRLPGMSGMEVLSKVCSEHPDTAAIMITAVNDVETAVEAMKLGALDYLVKPLDLEKINTTIRTVSETKKHLSERGNRAIPLYIGGEEEEKEAMEESSSEMTAIARGVESRYDLLTAHSNIVTQRTIGIARQLGIPEKKIQSWAAARALLDSKRNRVIDSPPNRVKRSPLAEGIMSVTKLLLHEPDLSETQD